MSTLIASTARVTLSMVKFYCDVISRSCSQLINNLIDTFFSKLQWSKEKEGRPVMVKRKLDGAVDESSADREIRKSDTTVYNL